MATYVFSDVHGHHRTLERLLERVSPASEDEVWILGDMVDRGPDPVSVMRTCRELADGHILLGNHEDMLLSALLHPHDPITTYQWEINGGSTTAHGLAELPHSECLDWVEWISELPLGAHIEVGGRQYLLVHAGLRPLNFTSRSRWTDVTMDALLRYQDREDVLWIREDFWCEPTGFVSEQGEGPVVIAGHTPVPYVEQLLLDKPDVMNHPARNENGECQILQLGACEQTGFVADRWAIDCGAAGGAGWGSVGMVRLDDGTNSYEEYYEPVLEGE